MPAHPFRTLLLASSLCALASAVDAAGAPPLPSAIAVTPAQARDDVRLAIAVAEAALPDLYWHQSPGEWDAAKARALAAAAGADEAMDVWTIVAQLMAHVGEGHLDVIPGDAAVAHQRATARLLPLDLHWSREGVFISGVHGGAAGIPPGSRLLAINGEDAQALLAELVSLSARDGRIETGAMRECPGRCYAVLRQRARGDEAGFDLHYATPAGESRRARVAAQPMRGRPPAAARERRIASLQWLSPGVAYLDVPSFSNRVYREAGTTFADVMRDLFGQVEQGGADRLVLDLRENGGGSEPNEAILFSYLVPEPLRRYRSVEARARTLSVASPSGQVLVHEVYDAEEMRGQQVLDGGRLSRLDRPPEGLTTHWTRAAPVYGGRLVVLAGGRTFSGGAELAAMLRHVRRARFVGEETGGTYEGNTSGYAWDVVLPHSGVNLGMPLLRFRFDWDADTPGRGVLPDCDVPPQVSEIGVQRDRAWRVARALVETDPAQPAACPDAGVLSAAADPAEP
ncbi:S41 family peptidase [Pseudoxanthomonas sp. 10H]|uniref:S41 family peptidase n=1 Tax=Pseudoxanthomonas sp. 10H TaxID=3242729 RepID=UPI0035587877